MSIAVSLIFSTCMTRLYVLPTFAFDKIITPWAKYSSSCTALSTVGPIARSSVVIRQVAPVFTSASTRSRIAVLRSTISGYWKISDVTGSTTILFALISSVCVLIPSIRLKIEKSFRPIEVRPNLDRSEGLFDLEPYRGDQDAHGADQCEENCR